ncbi:hypothetical protein Poli38472_010668 [Pythium oligandrum]|uniref:C5orf34-like C-terminal domain-containing protein n=1 Tax=Pythium oligandrum TaxID=41045 RepID=A0A8K1FB62_PYTOL|nr:hypothetical protein Poli38472_010668 [Pythium oligandrum]|eukprot:TMW55786.1 hypothetical protein Poli38472_010668 [Pythium oligandrum]
MDADTRLRRALVLRDGAVVACFTKQRHVTHTVVLEPNGHAYTYVGPTGRPTRHLTPTALYAHVWMVDTAMRIRNRYVSCVSECPKLTPYVHRALIARSRRPQEIVYRRRGAFRIARWPKGPTYQTKGLWNDATQMLEIASIEGSARIRLHASGRIAFASFLVEMKRSDDEEGEDFVGNVPHVLVEQTLVLNTLPKCFAYPIAVLLAARDAHERELVTFDADAIERVAPDAAELESSTELPRNCAFIAQPSFRPLFTSPSDSQPLLSTRATDLTIETLARLLRTPTQTLDRAVAVHVSEQIAHVVGPDASVLIHHEQSGQAMTSVIEGIRGYFEVFAPHGAVAQRFTAETIPLRLEGFCEDVEQTQAIITRATEFARARQQETVVVSPLHHQSDASQEGSDGPTQVVETAETSIGRFRAFSDGRVRVVFADRTIVQVDKTQSHCSFIYRDGSQATCTTTAASPDQWQYLKAALEFAEWAFDTPEGRYEKHLQRQHQQLLIDKELQRITVRRELNGTTERGSQQAVEDTHGHESVPLSALSVALINQLQEQTQQHLSSVQALLTERDDSHSK